MRQVGILKQFLKQPEKPITIKEIVTTYSVAYATARNDLFSLEKLGYAEKRKVGKLYFKTLQDDSGKFLKDSKKYEVSSKLKKAKSEYEAALSDCKSIGKYFMEAVKKTKAGNSKGANAALKSAKKYTDSFSKHMNKFVKYLNAYK